MKTGTRMNAMTPEKPLQDATSVSRQADLALVLGSSMQVSPFCDLPSMAKAMVLCNLQKTRYDDRATVVIRQRCDRVLREIMSHYGLTLTSFVYTVPFLTSAQKKGNSWTLCLTGVMANEPCTCVDSVQVVTSDGNKHTLEQQRDLSFTLDLPASVGSSVKWVVSFKEQYGVTPLECTMDLSNESITIERALSKHLHF